MSRSISRRESIMKCSTKVQAYTSANMCAMMFFYGHMFLTAFANFSNRDGVNRKLHVLYVHENKNENELTRATLYYGKKQNIN